MKVQIEESWRRQLQEEFDKPYFEHLVGFVKEEYARYTVFPPGSRIFHAYNTCPFRGVKAVFISGIFLTNWEVTDIPNVVVGRISALYIFRKKQNIFMAAAVPIVGNFRESTICRQGHWIGIWVIRMQIKTSRTGGLSSVSKTIS